MEVSYLQDDTDRDLHDTACCCGVPSPLPHRARGASLYKLDLEGARAWYALRVGTDEERFADWCLRQDSQGTFYGINPQAAQAEALQQAHKQGWLVLNALETRPKPDHVQDARAPYQSLPLYRRYLREPEHPPRLSPDIAPFPVWLVPPGWRLARLSDVAQVAGYPASPNDAGALLILAGITFAPPPIDLLGVWGWNDGNEAAIVTWQVEKTTGEYLVLWRAG